MNILFSTVGRRGYIVKFFREQIGSKDVIHGGDNSPYAPGLSYCDQKTMFPKVTEPDYVDVIFDYCIQKRIDIVIPLIDPELEVLAAQRDSFFDNNIMLMVSPLKTIEVAFDKYLTYEYGIKNNIAVPLTFLSITDALDSIKAKTLSWPLVVKARKGSASQNIFYCDNEEQLTASFQICPNPMIQEVMQGDEYGLDVFGAKNSEPISVFCKKKLIMRAGETDKAVSTDNPILIDFGKRILESLEIFGPCDLDVFLTDQGPKLLEINPRFGGGYPCSHLAGAEFPKKILAMRSGMDLICDIGSCPADVVMMKQDEIVGSTESELKQMEKRG